MPVNGSPHWEWHADLPVPSDPELLTPASQPEPAVASNVAPPLARATPFAKSRALSCLSSNICRGEAAALECRDVAPDTIAGAILVTVRRSKTEPEGTAADVRYLNNGAAAAVLALRLPRLGLGAGFLASASARAWFSASRRLSTSRRAPGLMV